ncbi:MAG TPA: sigma-70 family RNA polymerase sigma factor [Hanamia sp.]|nr:sigma-70 family RNA polymerase sigma factor [Hanamia sp.]
MNNQPNLHQLTDRLFRHEAGKMVSVLAKIFGASNLETAEDVVQQTFMDAINVWKFKGVPDNPSAWLFRVAKNKAIDIIRRNKYSVQYDFSGDERILLTSEYSMEATMENLFNVETIKDDMLRMMFACSNPGISGESQITLILKTLCGFSTAEIAKTFLTSEDTISKRLYRTRDFFRKEKIKLEIPSSGDLKSRTDAVLRSIYLLFNEGYNSTHSEKLIREDLITEAMLLCKLLTENKQTQLPQVYALMALMCFHSARNKSRLTSAGEIILLTKQDRSKWDFNLIVEGNRYMNIAAFGNEISSYHIEAAIAFEHCTAESFGKTNWEQILKLYEWLCAISPSPIAELNKVVAIMEALGADKALQAMEEISNLEKIKSFYLYPSLLGEIHSRLHHPTEAKKYFEMAINLTKSENEKKLLQNKIAALLN